jgi:hypothetical protein
VYTHIDEVVIVANEQVAEDAGLVEVAEADHVLHPLDGGRVHGLDPSLRGQPLLLAVVVHYLCEIGLKHLHCPKTHEQFPSSFGNAEVISLDGKLFIYIFSKTTWKLFSNLQGILKKYYAKAFNAQVWASIYNLWMRRLMLYNGTTSSV